MQKGADVHITKHDNMIFISFGGVIHNINQKDFYSAIRYLDKNFNSDLSDIYLVDNDSNQTILIASAVL